MHFKNILRKYKNIPKISVITTCYNSGLYIRETIGSILNQKHNNFEIIIVDAGSNDNTTDYFEEIKNEKRVKIIISNGIKFYDGLSLGVKNSSADYIMFMPISDSYANMYWLQTCQDILESNTNISLVHGITIHNDDKGRKFYGSGTRHYCPSKEKFFSFWLASFFAFSEHSFCVRKNIYEKCMNEKILEFDAYNNRFQNEIKIGTRDTFNKFLTFTYNFNTMGYLSKFVPEISSYVKIHSNSNSEKFIDSNLIINPIYIDRVKKYRQQLFCGRINHYFRNSNGEIIKELDAFNLRNTIKHTFNFRIYDKIYFDVSDGMNKYGNQLVNKMKKINSLVLRNFNYLYYRCCQIFNQKEEKK